jgi:O-methyltransferase involved in polyketide biosynthesis
MEVKLTGLPETLLIPMWARATETSRADPIVRDLPAVELMRAIDYDFSKFDRARLSQWGCAVRARLLDEATQDFLDRHKRVCVVNLGAGLDTRHARLRHKDTLWYELDLPESLAVRKRFFTENSKYRFLARSVFDQSWFEDVAVDGRKVLLIAEGLFMYFDEQEIRTLFARMAERFPEAEILLEIQGPAIVGKSRRHDSVSKLENAPDFKWGTSDDKAPEKWSPKIRVNRVWRFLDCYPARIGWVGWLMRLPFLRAYCEPRIVELHFEANSTA